MQRVAIIDYEMGNLHSVAKAIERVAPGARVEVTDRAERIKAADRVIFPGVGAMRDCMAAIRDRKLDEVIAVIAGRKPLLAVCVGMQALMQRSEENGGVACLGLFEGDVRRFPDQQVDASGQRLKVPHMGWNQVWREAEHPLWGGIEDGSRFYFVHSYFVRPAPGLQAAHCDYGQPFAACLSRDNIFATQFHPEKSHEAGLKLLENFMNWDGAC